MRVVWDGSGVGSSKGFASREWVEAKGFSVYCAGEKDEKWPRVIRSRRTHLGRSLRSRRAQIKAVAGNGDAATTGAVRNRI